MILEKSSVHNFTTNAVSLELTEYPFYSGEEIHIEINALSNIDRVSLTGNPENRISLVLNIEDAIILIKGDPRILLPKLEAAIKEYKTSWGKSDYRPFDFKTWKFKEDK